MNSFYEDIKQLSYLTCLLLLFPCLSAKAQLIPDSSLGKDSSTVNPSIGRDLIEGGVIRDNNLFHSFQEFNIDSGQKVYFINPVTVRNILTRVTGSNISRILGTLGVDGAANLFLINPNGIVFRENAKLDIGGSFLASTANSIIFDNYIFSTLNPETPPLLKINLPLGLQFNSSPGEIEVQGTGHNLTGEPPIFLPIQRSDRSTGLRVNPGNTFALIGGNVNLSGGVLTAETGRIELAAVNADGVVGIRNQNQGWEFDYSGVENFGDVELREESLADVSGVGSGSVEVRSRNLLISDGSVLWTQNLGDVVSGDINVNVTDSLEINGTSPDTIIRSGLYSEALGGKGGNITVNSKRVAVLGGGSIAAHIHGEFKGGNVNVNSAESILVSGISVINPVIQSTIVATTFNNGDAGDNIISTGQLTISDGAAVSSTTLGKGNAGNVSIRADSVEVIGDIENSFGTSLTTATLGEGTAGNLTIDTTSLIVRDGGNVSASTASNGNGGNLIVNASEFVEVRSTAPGQIFISSIANSSIRVNEFTRQLFNLPLIPSGNPGSITIITPLVRVLDGGLITVRSDGATNPGRLEINANSISLENEGGIIGTTISGSGGNIQLNTNKLQINNGIINASTSGSGRGGNITINASESVEVIGGGFDKLQENIINPPIQGEKLTLNNFDTGIVTVSQGEGSSGNILIQTPNFSASDGGLVATTTLTQGKGGDIEINADNILKLDNSLLNTATFTNQDSGNVNLSARQFTAIGGAQVITNTFASGNAGNLTVNVSDSIDLIDPSLQGFTSGLFATSSQTASGRGGDINIKTGDFNIVDRAAVSVSSEGIGDAGDIDIEAIRLFLENSSITATSISGEGGNINLRIPESLILRNNSRISTQAGTETSGGGNGGNITIDGGLIVAVPSENSDINANAFQGNGGNINIATPGLFGIQFRLRQTENSDITASSEFGLDGNFNLDLQAVNPNNGLIELPENLTDASDRISAGCPSDAEARFVTSGRGGLPVNPRQLLQSEVVLQDLRNIPSSTPTPPLPHSPSLIKEATGWIVNQQGEIEFVAHNVNC